MVTLIDQSDPTKLLYRCDRCRRTFVSTPVFAPEHRIPMQQRPEGELVPCTPLPVVDPVDANEPAPKRTYKPRVKKVESVPAPVVAKKPRGRPKAAAKPEPV